MFDSLNYQQTKDLIAIALRYKQEIDDAPRVIASGTGNIADKIIAEAKKANIPIKQDADLASLLALVNLNEYIPFEAFYMAAKIFTCIYNQNKR